MAEEIDESGFYREDFSTESEWEVFNAQLGEIFQKWELSQTDWGRDLDDQELFASDWSSKTESVELLGKEISVSYFMVKVKNEPTSEDNSKKFDAETLSPFHCDLMSQKNTFGPIFDNHSKLIHPLALWYGLRRFVIIRPRFVEKYYFSNSADFSFFLSAATVVAAEVGAVVPIFVQIFDPKWNFYVGVGHAPGLRTNFDLVTIKQSPKDLHYLSGLMTAFREKCHSTYMCKATVSVRNTYTYRTVNLRFAIRVPFSTSLSVEKENVDHFQKIDVSQFIALPYGYFLDSCTEVLLVYVWPEIDSNIYIDSELRTDFVPKRAPLSNVRLMTRCTSYLSTCLRDFEKLHGETESLESYVGRHFTGNASSSTNTNSKKLPGPMSEKELQQMLIYLFPYKTEDGLPLFDYAFHNVREEHGSALFDYPFYNQLRRDPHGIKSAHVESLVCRLSCLLSTCYSHFGGKKGLAQIWAAFTRELRFIWENGLLVPGVASGFPDTRTCLLNQKLQMLNICLKRSNATRPTEEKHDERAPKLSSATTELDEDDEDEFYDCDEPPEGAVKPEGRLKCLGDMKLLDSDEPLYVPVTQEPVPKTEDQLLDEAQVMLKLGPGSGVTTQMMCSTLRSDMEAFKAANPNAKIEDFIRWYSPKDWEEIIDDDGKVVSGNLSARMLTPDNAWQTIWKQAQSVPVWRQKCLFDHTNEGLKVLHYLETRSIGEIYELSIVPMLHSAILKLKDIFSSQNVLDLFQGSIDMLLAGLSRLSHEIEIVAESESVQNVNRSPSAEPLIKQIEELEKDFYKFMCFTRIVDYPEERTLKEAKDLYVMMFENGRAAQNLFKNYTPKELISKDYVIRINDESTTLRDKNQAGPQFLRAIVTGESIRLCGAFSESTAFV